MTDLQLKERAKDLAKELRLEDCKVSSGWLDNFKKRSGLSQRKSIQANASQTPSSPQQVRKLAARDGTKSDQKKVHF